MSLRKVSTGGGRKLIKSFNQFFQVNIAGGKVVFLGNVNTGGGKVYVFNRAFNFNRHRRNRSEESGNPGKGAFRAGLLTAAVISSKAGFEIDHICAVTEVTFLDNLFNGGVVAELSKRFHVLVSGYGIRQRHGRRHVNGKSK
jgi:hypothetical protein